MKRQIKRFMVLFCFALIAIPTFSFANFDYMAEVDSICHDHSSIGKWDYYQKSPAISNPSFVWTPIQAERSYTQNGITVSEDFRTEGWEEIFYFKTNDKNTAEAIYNQFKHDITLLLEKPPAHNQFRRVIGQDFFEIRSDSSPDYMYWDTSPKGDLYCNSGYYVHRYQLHGAYYVFFELNFCPPHPECI